MKSFVLIFTALLSFFFGGNRANNVCDRSLQHTDAVVQCSDNDASGKKADFNDVAILPIRTVSYSGNGDSFAPSFRSTNSGRRVQPSYKSSFRVIKTGRVFDRNNFYTFQTDLKQFSSGIHSTNRYIHSLCQLLI